MTQIKLKRLLSKRKKATSILHNLIDVANILVSIQDVEGQVLLGAVSDETLAKYPIRCGDDIIGWIVGQEQAVPIAALIGHLADKEAEKDALADEMLERYRELNLFYNLSEKLVASLELASVARTVIDEASRLIKSSGGCVVLSNKQNAELEPIATFGQGFQLQMPLKVGEGIIGEAALNGKAEIVNDIHSDARYADDQGLTSVGSLVCAPLKAKNRVIGVIVLVSEAGVTYTAGDLKLLNTLASQAAPAIENVLLYEKTLREAREREERLQRQIQGLRIELDEAQQNKQVAEITETDYFQQLRSQADSLRKIIENP